MSAEPEEDDGRTPRQRDRDRKYRDHVARLQRRERLEGCVTEVRRIYQSLRYRAERGSQEWSEFDELWRHHSEVEKTVFLLPVAEQERILEEYPKLAHQLKAKYGR